MRPIIAITGAGGYIGSALTVCLAEKGFKVIANCSGKVAIKHPNVQVIRADLTDKRSVELLMEQAEHLLHFGESGYPRNGAATLDSNRFIRDNILESYNRIGESVHFTYCSSGGAVYRDSHEAHTENSATFGYTPYASFKLESERLYQSSIPENCLTILRPGNVYGFSVNNSKSFSGKQGIVNHAIHATLHRKSIDLVDPVVSRDFIYIEDFVRAVLALIESRQRSGIFNVGTGEATTIGSLLAIISEMFGFPVRTLSTGSRNEGPMQVALNCNKIKAFGWKPATSIRGGIKAMVATATRFKEYNPGEMISTL